MMTILSMNKIIRKRERNVRLFKVIFMCILLFVLHYLCRLVCYTARMNDDDPGYEHDQGKKIKKPSDP